MPPGPGEIRVRAILSGVSAGTELAVYRGTIANLTTKRWGYWTEFPIRPGYQLVGRVEEIGVGVDRFAVGDRVVGHSPHATEATLAADDAVLIPDGVTDEDATFAMLGATTAHGVRRAGIEYGARVLVLGLGVVGWLAAEHAARAGARSVDIADPAAWKREFAEARGYRKPMNPDAADFEEQILDRSDGRGMDVVIEASGRPEAIPAAMQAIRRGGTVLIQGTHTEPVSIRFGDYPLHKEVRIVCAWGKGAVGPAGVESPIWTRRANQEFAMDLIRRDLVRVRDLVTHRFDFEELPEVYSWLNEAGREYFQIILNYTTEPLPGNRRRNGPHVR